MKKETLIKMIRELKDENTELKRLLKEIRLYIKRTRYEKQKRIDKEILA